jgi:MoaA/NifB/PqqE/SkfB family radical SAM enzyme
MAPELNAAGIAAALAAEGISFKINGRARTVRLALNSPAAPERARGLLYRALNGLEPHFNVFIEGAPYCFMPDAWDHISYRKKAGTAYTRFGACAACRLAELCPGLKKGGVYAGPARGLLAPVLARPSEIVFELTKKCNLNCRLCFASASGETQPLKVLREALRAARRLGVSSVRFTGGEPFLSPSLLPLLKEAKAAGLYTLVNTNAALPNAALFKKAAPFIDNVLVSLQAATAAAEKEATGGDFRVKLANMGILRAAVPVFRLGTVASKELLEEFDAYHALAGRLKADLWEIYRPMPDGRGRADTPVLTPGPADFKKLSARISKLGARAPRTVLANPLPLCLVPEQERVNLLGAAYDDGHTRLVFDPRGFYKPSYYLEDDLGADPGRAWRSGALKKITSVAALPAACRRCGYLLKCLGGSRAAAKKARGKYSSPDPWMPMLKRRR